MGPSGDDEIDRRRALQRDVLGYLVEHLEAKDTVDGIMQWWLGGAPGPVRRSDVSAALEDLVLRGWLTATSLGPGVVLYGLARARLDDVRRFLER
jgi:hypothetical protein